MIITPSGVRLVTWAQRPTSPTVGDRISLTDYAGKVLMWNGVQWVPHSGQPWAKSAVAVGIDGATSTAKTALQTVTIPGGLLGPDGQIVIKYRFSMNGSGSKSMYIDVGGVGVFGRTRTTTTAEIGMIVLANRGTQASMMEVTAMNANGSPFGTNLTASVPVYSINSAADFSIVFSGQSAVAAELVKIEAFSIDLFP